MWENSKINSKLLQGENCLIMSITTEQIIHFIYCLFDLFFQISNKLGLKESCYHMKMNICFSV